MQSKFVCLMFLWYGSECDLLAQEPDLYDETVLRTMELSFSQPDWWEQLRNLYDTGIDIPADLTVEGVTYSDVGVRFKGNSSYVLTGGSQKKSFNISLDSFVSGQELYGYETLNLNNSYTDPTFCREVLASKIFRNFVPTPKANFVKLVINGENWGVYANVQQVSKDMIEEWFQSRDGNRYKASQALPNAFDDGSALTWLGAGVAPYLDNYDLKTPTNPNPWADLITVCYTLNNTPLGQLQQELQPIFNVDRAIWMLVTSNVFVDPDSYVRAGEEYFLYQDEVHGRLNVVQYDLNESFGASFMNGFSVNSRIEVPPFYHDDESGLPLLNVMIQEPELRQVYLAHMRTLVEKWLDWNVVGPIVNQYYALIDAEVQADDKKLYSYQRFLDNRTRSVSTGFLQSAAGLKQLVEERREFLLNHPDFARPFPLIPEVQQQPQVPQPGEPVWITAEVQPWPGTTVREVKVFSRVRGAFIGQEMFDDGQHNDGLAQDGVWGVSLTAGVSGEGVQYYVRAALDEAVGGGMRFAPQEAEHAPYEFEVGLPATIRINEFLAKNDTGATDEQGEHEDWIELYNNTGQSVDLSGYYLSDDSEEPLGWPIPNGTVLGAGEVLLVWADDDPGDGPMHATFKLAVDGEEILLSRADGTLLDHVVFGEQVPDVATGRLQDGGDLWVSFASPTPQAPNSLSICGARSFDQLDADGHALRLDLIGTVAIGNSFDLQVCGATPGEKVFFVAATNPGYFEELTASGVVLLDPETVLVRAPKIANASGCATLTHTLTDPNMAGAVFYVQALEFSDTDSKLSNAWEILVCP